MRTCILNGVLNWGLALCSSASAKSSVGFREVRVRVSFSARLLELDKTSKSVDLFKK